MSGRHGARVTDVEPRSGLGSRLPHPLSLARALMHAHTLTHAQRQSLSSFVNNCFLIPFGSQQRERQNNGNNESIREKKEEEEEVKRRRRKMDSAGRMKKRKNMQR